MTPNFVTNESVTTSQPTSSANKTKSLPRRLATVPTAHLANQEPSLTTKKYDFLKCRQLSRSPCHPEQRIALYKLTGFL